MNRQSLVSGQPVVLLCFAPAAADSHRKTKSLHVSAPPSWRYCPHGSFRPHFCSTDSTAVTSAPSLLQSAPQINTENVRYLFRDWKRIKRQSSRQITENLAFSARWRSLSCSWAQGTNQFLFHSLLFHFCFKLCCRFWRIKMNIQIRL